MDPYAKITVGQNTQQTRTANDMGKRPAWSDSLTFNIRGDQSMHIALWDKDYGSKDDYICETNINLTEIFQRRTFNNQFPLQRKGKSAGQITIAFEFHPDGMGMGMGQGMAQPYGQAMYNTQAPGYGAPAPGYQ
jgi:Ca2+-dependent lipid-binding protein